MDGCGWMCTCKGVCTERTGCWSVRLRQKVSTSCLTLLMGMVAEPRKSSLLSMSWSNTMKLWKEGGREGNGTALNYALIHLSLSLSLCVCVCVCVCECVCVCVCVCASLDVLGAPCCIVGWHMSIWDVESRCCGYVCSHQFMSANK